MRPRQFDNDNVLQIAFDSFWRRGIGATSLSDIAKDAGVQRGSLYNAFGSKEALFLSAYDKYAQEYLASVEETLKEGCLRDRLRRLFEFAISNFCAGEPSRGCPTTRGLMEIASVEGEGLGPSAKEAFSNLLNGTIKHVENTLIRAQANDEFDGDPHMTAEHLVTVARGLVVLERAFGNEEQLKKIAYHSIDTALKL